MPQSVDSVIRRIEAEVDRQLAKEARQAWEQARQMASDCRIANTGFLARAFDVIEIARQLDTPQNRRQNPRGAELGRELENAAWDELQDAMQQCTCYRMRR